VGSCCFLGKRWEALLAWHSRPHPRLASCKLIQISIWRKEITVALSCVYSFFTTTYVLLIMAKRQVLIKKTQWESYAQIRS
jgi:hypothetical protein